MPGPTITSGTAGSRGMRNALGRTKTIAVSPTPRPSSWVEQTPTLVRPGVASRIGSRTTFTVSESVAASCEGDDEIV